MFFSNYLSKNYISLDDILKLRDNRVLFINELLNQWQKTIIVFSLNMIGPIKVFNLSIDTFFEGVNLIKEKLDSENISIEFEKINKDSCGYEGYFVVSKNSYYVKKLLSNIENNITIGRLFDIDVINEAGVKVSREDINLDRRKCIICDNPVFLCSRSRKHNLDELVNKEIDIMLDYFSNKISFEIAEIAEKSLILELKTTPKPGLVDLNNNGSHKDLNANLFIESANTLKPYFREFFLFGYNNSDVEIDLLFESIRKIGINAEKAMFIATNNVNTHKGAIFIYSIVLSSLGWLYKNQNYSRSALKKTIKELSKNILDDYNKSFEDDTCLTNGEKLYKKYGIFGIRGEAQKGFSSVLDKALLNFDILIKKGFSLNLSGVVTLLNLLLLIEDTNIISRSNLKVFENVREKVRENINQIENLDYIYQLDKEFIDLNISAGGCADLLALTYFIHFFEEALSKNFNLINS